MCLENEVFEMLIQEIGDHNFDIAYKPVSPGEEDPVLLLRRDEVLLSPETGEMYTYADIKDEEFAQGENLAFVFTLDGKHVFTTLSVSDAFYEKAEKHPVRSLGKERPELQLAGATTMHLHTWYKSHQYCGCCGGKNHHDTVERAMKCEKCGHLTFPVICPAIIVAVTDGDRILLTLSARHKNPIYSLIAGFTEIGETLEQTAAREAFEECGVRIKNIRPYINQPWGFSSSLMVGFFADLDGSDEITIQPDEIKEARWFTREEMPVNDSPIDITHHMMEMWRQGKV